MYFTVAILKLDYAYLRKAAQLFLVSIADTLFSQDTIFMRTFNLASVSVQYTWYIIAVTVMNWLVVTNTALYKEGLTTCNLSKNVCVNGRIGHKLQSMSMEVPYQFNYETRLQPEWPEFKHLLLCF